MNPCPRGLRTIRHFVKSAYPKIADFRNFDVMGSTHQKVTPHPKIEFFSTFFGDPWECFKSPQNGFTQLATSKKLVFGRIDSHL